MSRYLQVTPHAVVRARQRYGLAHVDWKVIHDDVYDAILAGRAGKLHPNGSGYACAGDGMYAWTPNLLRVYVFDAFENREGRVCLRVLTALPGCYSHEEFRANDERRAA